MLTPRMQMIATFSGVNNTLADIGCDHGKLCAYLIKENLAKTVYATDISEQSLQKAKKLKEKECLNGIEFFLGDGFNAFNMPVDCAVIAGMGGETICNILMHKYAKTKLVLQPMKDSDILYKYLVDSGFCIEKVKIVREGGRFYEIILCIPGYNEKFDFSLPPMERLVKDEDARDFLIHKINVLKKTLSGVSKTKMSKNRLNVINENIKRIEEVLNNEYCF